MILQSFLISILASSLFTPMIIKLAKKSGIVDIPNYRKVHKVPTPLLGGLAIYFSFLVGVWFVKPSHPAHVSILIGSMIIIIIGILDDRYELSPKVKFFGQILAAAVVIFYGNLFVHFINLPFNGSLQLGWLTVPITFLWIVGVTNAINLIDGLDGLSAGVTGIAMIAMAGMAYFMGDLYVLPMAVILIGAIIGFLPYNFYPAKIFMGDTGALFLGFMISILSLLGFKNITFITFIVPLLILGVPISDTVFAIIRRLVNRKPISRADKSHLHHRLLELGFSHRQAVLLIYCLSAMFAMFAFVFSMTTIWGSFFLLCIIILALELLIEKLGLINKNYKPILRVLEYWRMQRSRKGIQPREKS